jgi:hypothetical protein
MQIVLTPPRARSGKVLNLRDSTQHPTVIGWVLVVFLKEVRHRHAATGVDADRPPRSWEGCYLRTRWSCCASPSKTR